MPYIDEVQERAVNARKAYLEAVEKMKGAIENNDANAAQLQKEVEHARAAYDAAMADFDDIKLSGKI